MQEPHEQPLATAEGEPTRTVLRRPWQRPTLQRLHVSMDTAAAPGSGTDGENRSYD